MQCIMLKVLATINVIIALSFGNNAACNLLPQIINIIDYMPFVKK